MNTFSNILQRDYSEIFSENQQKNICHGNVCCAHSFVASYIYSFYLFCFVVNNGYIFIILEIMPKIDKDNVS